MSCVTENALLDDASTELYNAIEAIEKGDLPFARSSSLRAANRIVEAHQAARKSISKIEEEIVDG